MTLLSFVTNHFRRHPVGSFFIVFLLAATTALSVAVNLQERALREGSARAADQFDLLIGAAGSETQLVLSTVFLQAGALTLLSAEQVAAIDKNPLVAWSSPVGFGDFFQGRPIVGVNRDLLTLGGTREPSAGRFFTHHNEAVVGGRSGLQLGEKITPLHGKIGDPTAHAHDSTTYTVVGVLPISGSVWDQAILVPMASVWQLHEAEKNHHHSHDRQKPLREQSHNHSDQAPDWWRAPLVDDGRYFPAPAVIVKPKSIAGAYQLRSQYRGSGTQAIFPAEVLVRLYTTLGDAKQILTGMAFVAQLLVALAIAVIIAIYLQQQQKQIAALRAFGAPRGRIFFLVWGALLFLLLVAILLGGAIGFAVAAGISETIGQENGFILPVRFVAHDGLLLLGLFAVAALTLLVPSLAHYRTGAGEILR